MYIPERYQFLHIRAEGRGDRQMCRMDSNGFPRTSTKQYKRVDELQTGDLVRAVVPQKYKASGTHVGKLSVRSNGYFSINKKNNRVDGINSEYCELLQRADGYSYSVGSEQTIAHFTLST